MSSPLSHVPAVAIAPPARCYFRLGDSSSTICGNFARWLRPGNHWFDPEYFCDLHRASSDIAIPSEWVFRRVRFELEVLITAAALNPSPAHTEALARLDAAVKAAGGVLDVHGVRSSVVRACPQAPAARQIAAEANPT